MSDQPETIVIIGGGPAGASAATFTARAGLTTVVIDADKGMTRRAWSGTTSGSPRASPDQNWSTTAAPKPSGRVPSGSRARLNRWKGRRRVHRPHRCW